MIKTAYGTEPDFMTETEDGTEPGFMIKTAYGTEPGFMIERDKIKKRDNYGKDKG